MSDTARTQDLIRKIASDHGVALDRNDPILIVQTATQHLLVEALEQARKDQEEALAEHRKALEGLSASWQRDATDLTRTQTAEVMRAARTSVEEALGAALAPAVARLRRELTRHEGALSKVSIACVLAAVVSTLAASVTVMLVGSSGALP